MIEMMGMIEQSVFSKIAEQIGWSHLSIAFAHRHEILQTSRVARYVGEVKSGGITSITSTCIWRRNWGVGTQPLRM